MFDYKKYIFGIAITISLLQFNTKAQSTSIIKQTTCLRAIYQLEYKIYSLITIPKEVRMTLRVSNGISRFQSVGMYFLDSVYTSLNGTTEKERLQKSLDATRKGGKNEFRYTILKEPAKNQVFYHDNINSEDYQ